MQPKKETFHALDQIAPENCIMGPFQLTDYVGLDVVLALMETLQYELGSNIQSMPSASQNGPCRQAWCKNRYRIL